MEKKLKNLIQQSYLLSEEEKKTYLMAIPLLPAEKLKELERILDEEAKSVLAIKRQHVDEKKQFYKGYANDAKVFFKQEKKRVIAESEQEERVENEKILDQLYDIES